MIDSGLLLWHAGRVVEQYKRNPNAKCVICDKSIYRRPVELQKSNGRAYCGMACYGISCRKEIPCVMCGQPILAGKNRKTCSRSCANKHRAGIKYKMNRPRDKVVSERALKVRLMKERGKTCEKCGYDKLEILQIHHKDRNRNNGDLHNLELLCPNCHFSEHYLDKSWLKDTANGRVG